MSNYSSDEKTVSPVKAVFWVGFTLVAPIGVMAPPAVPLHFYCWWPGAIHDGYKLLYRSCQPLQRSLERRPSMILRRCPSWCCCYPVGICLGRQTLLHRATVARARPLLLWCGCGLWCLGTRCWHASLGCGARRIGARPGCWCWGSDGLVWHQVLEWRIFIIYKAQPKLSTWLMLIVQQCGSLQAKQTKIITQS